MYTSSLPQAKYMTLLMLSWTLTARAMAEGDRGSSLCWLVEEPSPLLCGRRGQDHIQPRIGWKGGKEKQVRERKKESGERGHVCIKN